MSDDFIRHFVAALGFIIVFLTWFAGYKSGMNGWWWTGFGSIIAYFAVYASLKT